MADEGRYKASGAEGEFQPGSDGRVLKNLLDITCPEEMADVETALLLKLYEHLFEKDLPSSLSPKDIQDWHRWWLGRVYPWAGSLRSVNVSKGDFHFTVASYLPKALEAYGDKYLSRYHTLDRLEEDALFAYLAESHVEFILMHPFREGNGRISRLLMDVMATNAGYGPLDYSLWDKYKDYYFRSIQAGLASDYSHMTKLVTDIIRQTDEF